MLQDFIAKNILEQLPFEPTGQQDALIKELGKFLTSFDADKVFVLKGYAGTGKTTVVSALVKALMKHEQKTVLLAPTGRAAKVLSFYSGFSAFTIHKKIYRQKSMSEFRFQLSTNMNKQTLFIVDEASMISNIDGETTFGSGNLLNDLIQYIYSGEGCSLLLLGDIAQLPPVMQSVSPALEKNVLEGYGLHVTEFTLTQVVRQALNSGILHNATLLRNQLSDNITHDYPFFEIDNFSDIGCIKGEDLIEAINQSFNEVGMEDTIIINRSNKRTNIYNNGIRSRVMMREEELANGDLLMVTRNNYFWNKPYKEIDFIANGDILQVLRIKRYYEMYNNRFVDLSLRSLDYEWEIDARVWLESLQSESPVQTAKMNEQLFNTVAEDYADVRSKRTRIKKIMDNEFYNALQVKFAYAVTCHKAQGGQWKNVFIDPGFVPQEHLNENYYRWLYTALTRASEKVFLVNFQNEYFKKIT
jgi:exodeoxyribonuclease-5